MLAFFIVYFFKLLYNNFILYDRGVLMFDNKILVNLYVLALDKHFEIYIPVNDKMGNISRLLGRNFFGELSAKNYVIINVITGNIYNNNDLIRNTDIKNGTRLVLI